MKLYVGNLNFNTTEHELEQAFSAHGEVTSVNIITDRETGRPRGFAFVEMANKKEGIAAMNALAQTELDGRELVVNDARHRQARY